MVRKFKYFSDTADEGLCFPDPRTIHRIIVRPIPTDSSDFDPAKEFINRRIRISLCQPLLHRNVTKSKSMYTIRSMAASEC